MASCTKRASAPPASRSASSCARPSSVSTSGSHWTATSSAKSKRTSPKRWSVIVILPSMFWAMARSSACLISCRLVVERRCDPQLVGTGVREAHGAVGACDAARLEHVQQAGGRLNLAVGAVQFLWVVVRDDRGQPVAQRLVEQRLGAVNARLAGQSPRAHRVLARTRILDRLTGHGRTCLHRAATGGSAARPAQPMRARSPARSVASPIPRHGATIRPTRGVAGSSGKSMSNPTCSAVATAASCPTVGLPRPASSAATTGCETSRRAASSACVSPTASRAARMRWPASWA
jgi:hypothetical protein